MRVRMARIYSRLHEKVVWITKSMRELRSNPQSGACFKKSMDDPGLREFGHSRGINRRVGNNAVIIRVPSHAILLRNGCHRQQRRVSLGALTNLLTNTPTIPITGQIFLATANNIE